MDTVDDSTILQQLIIGDETHDPFLRARLQHLVRVAAQLVTQIVQPIIELRLVTWLVVGRPFQ